MEFEKTNGGGLRDSRFLTRSRSEGQLSRYGGRSMTRKGEEGTSTPIEGDGLCFEEKEGRRLRMMAKVKVMDLVLVGRTAKAVEGGVVVME